MIINNENHKNLKSNVPFEGLPRWFQDAKTEDACILYKRGVLEWENGKWYNGTWQEGIWYNGTWYGGVWNDGIWNGGVWHSGDWENGIWKGGVWYSGDWENGIWYNGKWHGGVWYRGTWCGGTWVGGFKEISIPSIRVFYNESTDKIRIGELTKTAKEWEEWFQNNEQDVNIYKSYLVAKYVIELEQESKI